MNKTMSTESYTSYLILLMVNVSEYIIEWNITNEI